MRPPARSRAAHAPVAQRRDPGGVAVALLTTLWVFVLFDPQWLLSSYGIPVLLRVPTALFVFVTLAIALEVPSKASLKARWNWHLPFLVFMGAGVATLPWALNNGFARQSIMLWALYWTLMVGTAAFVHSVQRAEKLLLLYAMSFVWYGVWGSWRGQVNWHYAFYNHDGFGALVVTGVGLCAFLTVAAPPGSRFRRVAAAGAALSVLGVVASFARGAFVASIAVAFLVWVRSKRKMRGLAIGIGGALMVLVAAEILHPGMFWAEMETIFTQGKDEGTGQDRWILWGAAVEIFKERPLFGVGPRNFGPFAAQFFEVGDLPAGGYGYTNNPGMLYNRSLHNIFVQIFVELGLVGSLAFIAVLVHFWRRNVALRTEEAAARWRSLGGRLDLRSVALGLEAGMVGYLIPGMFYGLLAMHWFYTLLAVNLLLYVMVFGAKRKPGTIRRKPLRRRVAPLAPPDPIGRAVPGTS